MDKKGTGILCGCGYDKSIVKKSFKRAFKELSEIEKAELYYLYCRVIHEFLNGEGEVADSIGEENENENENESQRKNGNDREREENMKVRAEIKEQGSFADWNMFTI